MYCVFSLEKTSKSRVQIVVNMDKTWRGPSSFVLSEGAAWMDGGGQ